MRHGQMEFGLQRMHDSCPLDDDDDDDDDGDDGDDNRNTQRKCITYDYCSIRKLVGSVECLLC